MAAAGRSSCPSSRGKSTFLESLIDASTTEIWEAVPSISSSNGGVRATPSRLPITALKMASASLPPAERVRATHMLTVVGSAAMARRPSRRVLGITPLSNAVMPNIINGKKLRVRSQEEAWWLGRNTVQGPRWLCVHEVESLNCRVLSDTKGRSSEL